MNLPTHVQRVLSVDPFDLLDRNFARGVAGPTAYGVDVREDADKLYIEAELPGYKKGDVEIELDQSMLTISARHAQTETVNGQTHGQTTGSSNGSVNGSPEPSQPAGEWLLRERRLSEYQRRFNLPASAVGATVEARLEDGILTVTLTKREETKPRKITVS